MSWIVYVVTFFISWWFFLFLVLPFGLRTQDEDEDVTLGTVASAPRGPHMLRAVKPRDAPEAHWSSHKLHCRSCCSSARGS